VLTAHEAQIAELVRRRDEVLAAHRPQGGVAVREDRSLEVVSALSLVS
jgi:hypothetical protein